LLRAAGMPPTFSTASTKVGHRFAIQPGSIAALYALRR
jgi:hypothetical protein